MSKVLRHMYPNYQPISLFRSHCHMRKVVNSTYWARFGSFKWKNPTGWGSFVTVIQGCRTYPSEASNCETQNQLVAGRGQAKWEHLAMRPPSAEPARARCCADLLTQQHAGWSHTLQSLFTESSGTTGFPSDIQPLIPLRLGGFPSDPSRLVIRVIRVDTN